jgi:hypothetical protein
VEIKRKMSDELIERIHGTSINPPKEPDDPDGYQAADVTNTGRRQRNVPKSVEGQCDI